MPASPVLASGRNLHHATARENGGGRKAMSSSDEGLSWKAGRARTGQVLTMRAPVPGAGLAIGRTGFSGLMLGVTQAFWRPIMHERGCRFRRFIEDEH